MSSSLAPSPAPSSLVNGFNHVAVITRDLDRLVAFYAANFDVPFLEIPDPRGRHGFLRLAGGRDEGDPGPVLHAFEMPEHVTGPFPPADDMFRRGRLDHVAIEAAGEAEFRELRDRLVGADATDGVIRVFGDRFLSLHVIDPDGMRLEVGCVRTGTVFDDTELEIAG
jgi:catechol 2,3-dioxygenase-like lactoylglutathione lyase family enzyme